MLEVLEQDQETLLVLSPSQPAGWYDNLMLWALAALSCSLLGSYFILQLGSFILVFGGLQVFLLAMLTYLLYRKTMRKQVLRFGPDYLLVERGLEGAGRPWRAVRQEVQFVQQPKLRASQEPCLMLNQDGNSLEIGAFLSAQEKQAVARVIRKQLAEPWPA